MTAKNIKLYCKQWAYLTVKKSVLAKTFNISFSFVFLHCFYFLFSYSHSMLLLFSSAFLILYSHVSFSFSLFFYLTMFYILGCLLAEEECWILLSLYITGRSIGLETSLQSKNLQLQIIAILYLISAARLCVRMRAEELRFVAWTYFTRRIGY